MTPDTFTNEEVMLDVGDGHTLYVHDWGNKDAKQPILFLHGGPGNGCSDGKKNQFNPETQRVIFFDQRGSGRSLPYGSIEHNETQDILSDIDKILDHLKIEKVILTGGSWGSALAFFYGIARPGRVTAMVLDGIWTCSKSETDWVETGGLRLFYPEAWQAYVDATPAEHKATPSAYHFTRILGDDVVAAKESGYMYETLEGSTISLDDRHTLQGVENFDLAQVRIEVHYLANSCFVSDRYVFDNAAKLTMPVYMIQGRYDMVCPPQTAYELSQVLPNVDLIWTTSGHIAERETWNVRRTIVKQLTS